MKLERNPVEGSFVPRPMGCIDLDPHTGAKVRDECRAQFRAHPKSSNRFQCPNRRAFKKIDGDFVCDGRGFLFPRRWARSGKFLHFHQGIDLFAKKHKPIRSVSTGVVVVARGTDEDAAKAGYGRVVAIYNRDLDRVFWYAHCETI